MSAKEMWIKVLTKKRSIVHVTGCDIWNDLGPFLNFFVKAFSSKSRSKEAKGLKSGNLGKGNFFININFLPSSILFLCTISNFQLKVV